MADLSTTWMGLELKSPVIAASCTLTGSVEQVSEAARCGAGAVVLKSLFEEQIQQDAARSLGGNEQRFYYAQAEDYIREYSRGDALWAYLELIRACSREVSVPVIASINCVSPGEWVQFAREIEEAGADGLEVNIFVMPSDPSKSSAENEKVYFDVLNAVTRAVRIPVAAKVSSYFSALAHTAEALPSTGIGSLVMFNRFFSPDIDIDTLELKPAPLFSTPADYYNSLRWIAMLSGRVGCDLVASTGVHDSDALVKQLLAGAKAVEIASVLYLKGFEEIRTMLEGLEEYMDRLGFSSLSDFQGRMSMKHSLHPAAWERSQFMKHFSDIS
ncbi:dihydroorotate dehydrogenase-like protein [Chlorobium phaeovibrioides]|uniref:Dihydroorotate dehydrogenase-like protein n=2 Tax=Chlorobium phaeovibrioides TaxID=1094 RepID=A0A432AW75_CHLPH|nr:dihydroorotate dehydrogenase-like protein [Chlorobium phaeovibrioides]HCD35769.1 dihydroorotate dehydrogenase-like protein [Chlorobium sp.]KAA6233258.1 dihydroorotate dehydrogenase-like protein [Chlorobium phaeovibrioides]MWV54251.1 dihydroorotate dehydrogenase-like protein [Chlorobium phaeovibrioides]QEQ56327.1 dihydroorotate dehydrogenase-like protein [Chlorobium phaeovibrioides]RTY36665.1 dihydroorotate dehydrogenase-like protein [Chlorobium phaeovibrioides]